MKKFFALLSILIVIMAFSSMSMAQNLKFAQDYKLNYKVLTVYTGTDQAVGDTSDVVEVPDEITNIIYHLEVDTVTTSDSLKSGIIQWSSTGTGYWVNVDTVTSAVAAAGTTRKVASTPCGKYFRFIYAVAGSDIKLDFHLKAIAKK